MTTGLITYENTKGYYSPKDQLFLHRRVNLNECILHITTF